MVDSSVVEVAFDTRFKRGCRTCGDVFLAKRLKTEDRVIAVLSDGLGSGIKAGVLATITATMALKSAARRRDICETARTIMRTLPVCKVRKISYATFTLVDADPDGMVRVVEYDNPQCVLVRDGHIEAPERELITIRSSRQRPASLHITHFEARTGDRLVLFTDGVTMSGMGLRDLPFGWGEEQVRNYITATISGNPDISARSLASALVSRAEANDVSGCGDDTTCAVLYFREPRNLLVMSGPPLDRNRDPEMAALFEQFSGAKVICGGTTSKIIARELGREITVDLRTITPDVPPVSRMAGATLVTEGIITLTKTAALLEKTPSKFQLDSASTRLLDQLLESDHITFVVGTRLNDANQVYSDSEIEIRRNVIRRIANLLEEKYLKEVRLVLV